MSIYATVPIPSATTNQLMHLDRLLAARFDSPDDIPEPLRCFIPQRGMTMAEASHAIDVVKQIPSKWQRQKALRQRLVELHRHSLKGKEGTPETVVAERWDKVLERHFHIYREVAGEHFTGKRMRIDRVLLPRGWNWGCGHEHAIGYEIKTGNCKTDVAQAADYANTRWGSKQSGQYIIVGLHRDHRDDSRPLADVGCFAFVVEHSYRLDCPALSLCWNGNRMWTGSLLNETRDLARTPWCPSRKFGSR